MKALAAITGVAPETLYANADLCKSDLVAQDVSWLIPLGVNVENARLTEPQKAAFERERVHRERQGVKRTRRETDVREFIRTYQTSQSRITNGNREELSVLGLEEILLSPLLKHHADFENLETQNAYFASVLLRLGTWMREANIEFFASLFQLFADLKLKPSKLAIKPLAESYLPVLGSALGEMLSRMEAAEVVDRWFVMRAALPEQQLAFATCLTEHRPLHPAVAVELAQNIRQLRDLVTFLERTWISVDADGAEQIAFMITRRKLSRDEIVEVLQARLPKSVAHALARQFMEHSDQTRLRYLIEWRDADRGAAGGLSLDTLFSAFKTFDIAVKTAESIWPNLGKGQRAVVNSVLGKLAYEKQDFARLRLLERDAPYSPSRAKYGMGAYGAGDYGGKRDD